MFFVSANKSVPKLANIQVKVLLTSNYSNFSNEKISIPIHAKCHLETKYKGCQKYFTSTLLVGPNLGLLHKGQITCNKLPPISISYYNYTPYIYKKNPFLGLPGVYFKYFISGPKLGDTIPRPNNM